MVESLDLYKTCRDHLSDDPPLLQEFIWPPRSTLTSEVKMKDLHCKEFEENSPNLSIIDQLCNFLKMIFDLQNQFSRLSLFNYEFVLLKSVRCHKKEQLQFGLKTSNQHLFYILYTNKPTQLFSVRLSRRPKNHRIKMISLQTTKIDGARVDRCTRGPSL